MPSLYKSLGISSQQEAAELEQDLGIRFSDFTPEDADTWIRQTLYLGQYANTRTFTHAAREAGVSLRHARTWQTENTLGFNQRLQIAVLEYTEEIEVLLLEQVRQPKPSPALLAMLLRAHLPEKYGPARRQSAPRDSHSDPDDPKPETSQDDRESLDDIRQDLQQLKQFAGLTDPTSNLSPAGEDTSHSNLSPAGGEIQRGGSSHADLPPVGAGFKPAPDPSPNGQDTSHPNLSPAGGEIQRGGSSHADLPPVGAGFKPAPAPSPTGEDTSHPNLSPASSHPSAPSPSSPSPVVGESLPRTRYGGEGDLPHPQHPAPSTQNPEPTLNRRQRRQLQRTQRKQRKARSPDTRTKQPNSHRPRAPN